MRKVKLSDQDLITTELKVIWIKLRHGSCIYTTGGLGVGIGFIISEGGSDISNGIVGIAAVLISKSSILHSSHLIRCR